MGVIMLIGATTAPLGDYFLGNIFEIFLEKIFKLKFFFCIILLRFVLKHYEKLCSWQ
jgi:hypothetical protein